MLLGYSLRENIALDMAYYYIGPVDFFQHLIFSTFKTYIRIARLAQSVEHEALNLRVVGSSPTSGEHYCYACVMQVMKNKIGTIILLYLGWPSLSIG